jgi:hypothetical protein
MKKELLTIADAFKRLANGLSDEDKNQLETAAAAIVALAGKADDEGKDEVRARIAQLSADIEKVQANVAENIAERIQKLRDEFAGVMNAGKKATDKLTPEIVNKIAVAIRNSTKAGREQAVMQVLKENEITGLTFPDVIKATVTYERKSTEIFDEFGTTDIDEHFLVGIDETNAEQIAKQFSDDASVQKDIQELAATGVTIRTAYIGKMQRFSNAALDKAEKAGTLNEVLNETTAELEYMTKRLAEKAAIVGDNVNASGKKVTVFETIGTATASSAKITVINPATANTVTLLDLAKAADSVDAAVSEKIAILDKTLARNLSAFTYASGGSTRILSDDDLAAQIGVRKIVKVDYLGEVTGLHAVILKPSAYKVQTIKEHSVAWPEWRNNAQYFIFEKNMGGALVELKSAAVLREA